jgi:hypothetical protein
MQPSGEATSLITIAVYFFVRIYKQVLQLHALSCNNCEKPDVSSPGFTKLEGFMPKSLAAFSGIQIA